jgi:hypothetical protein
MLAEAQDIELRSTIDDAERSYTTPFRDFDGFPYPHR